MPVSPCDLAPVEFAHALAQLHAGMQQIELPTRHFTDRVRTPELAEADRALLGNALRDLSRAIAERGTPEQLLRGEPHPGNVLRTKQGLLFIDLETCCRGPVAFDLAHAPEDAGAHYPDADQGLLRTCRVLVLAMIATWRWDHDDHFPNEAWSGWTSCARRWCPMGVYRAAREPSASSPPNCRSRPTPTDYSASRPW